MNNANDAKGKRMKQGAALPEKSEGYLSGKAGKKEEKDSMSNK